MYSPQLPSPLLDRLPTGELTCEQALKLMKGTIDLIQPRITHLPTSIRQHEFAAIDENQAHSVHQVEERS